MTDMGLSTCCYNFKNFVLQMGNDSGDLFSHFSRYVSPAYHHDKCERCVQMRLYLMNKGEITFIYVVFIVLLLLTIIIGLSGPPIESTSFYNVSSSISDLEHGGPFILTTPALTRYNRQLWMFAIFHTDNSDDEMYAENVELSVAVVGLHMKRTILDNVTNIVNNKSQNLSLFLSKNHMLRNRTRHIQCNKKICDPIIVGHLGYITYIRYRFYVKFHNLESFYRKYIVKQVTFVFRTYGSEFIQMEMSFRIIYVITTLFATLWFGNSLRKYVISDWSYEQKWTMLLLPLLLLYDDPVYSLTTLFDHWLIGFIDSVFQITFLATIALFFLCIYHAFRQNERRLIPFYMEKIVIIFALWVLSVTVAYYQKVIEYIDFSFSFKYDSVVYQTVTKWWLIFTIFYFVYLLLTMLKAYTDLRTMPFFDIRLKFATTNVVVMGTIWYITWSFDYGITGLLENQYISNLKDRRVHSTSVVFMALYASLNFYVYLMVYIYSPSQKSIFENVVMKDNPTFSMINDSEDEDTLTITAPGKTHAAKKKLLYASDDEDEDEHSLVPLNRTVTGVRTDDSD